MNRSSLFCLYLLLIGSCVKAVARDSATDSRLPPRRESIDLRTWPINTDFGRFEGGKLLYQETNPYWMGSDIYFARGSRVGILLKNDPSSVNAFFAAEIRRPRTVRTFIDEHLVMFLTENFGDFLGVVIDKNWVSVAREQKSFVLPSQPVVAGNTWALEFNVLTSRGAVQHWSFKGQVLPLRIDSFQCETRKPNGTFRPPVFVR